MFLVINNINVRAILNQDFHHYFITSCEYKDCIKEQERVTDCFTNCQKEYAATNSLIQTLNAKVSSW